MTVTGSIACSTPIVNSNIESSRLSSANLGLHPFAVQAVLREHQQQAVVDLDGPVDWLDEFLAPRHVFRSEPDPQLFATHLLVQPPSELLVPAAIADEARLVLNRLNPSDER